jgi:hypothetical protein
MLNTILVLLVSACTQLWARFFQKNQIKFQETTPATAKVQVSETTEEKKEVEWIEPEVNPRYTCPLCWDTLRVPVFIIFQWGQYDHKCTLAKRWCLRCVRSYFEMNDRNAVQPVKGCIQCGGFHSRLPRNAKDAYRIDQMLMEEMTAEGVVATCDCGTSFTNQHELHKHLINDCVNSYTSCQACRTSYKRGDGHRCPRSTCVVCGFVSQDRNTLRWHVQEHRDAANAQLNILTYY